MHEYLVQILAEAPDPALQKAQDAEERLRFWLQRTRAVLAPEVARAPRRRLAGVRALLSKPIPLVESLRLWRYARRGDERRMLWRNLRGFGVRLGLVIVLLSPGWGYLSMELIRRARDMGALVVENPLRATLTLRCIRHYQNPQACSPDEPPLKGSSVYVPGPADYVLTAQVGTEWQVRYTVYIQGYGHRITVTVARPPEHLPEGMVYIPGGVFRMGDKDATDGMGLPEEVPAHDVEVDGFLMDQMKSAMNSMPSVWQLGNVQRRIMRTRLATAMGIRGGKRSRWNDDFREATKPVVCVAWGEARAYCESMRKRLPTEAEWEKAAAGPEGYTWSFGNPPFDGTKANYCDENCDLPWWRSEDNDGYATTAPVGVYPPNGYSLYDMSGNVTEWVADWYDKEFYKKLEALLKNPENREPGSGLRVVRGGAWYNLAANLRVANRDRNGPADRNVNVGFRCVPFAPSNAL